MNDEEYGTTKKYKTAFQQILKDGGLPKHQLALVKAHFAARGHTATWAQIAKAVKYKNRNPVQLHYGKLAKRVARLLGINKPPERGFWLDVLAGWARERDPKSGHTRFVLRRPVIEALTELGLLTTRGAG